jgi:hypothetical protein
LQKKLGPLAKYPIGNFIVITFLLTYGLGIPLSLWISQNFWLPQPLHVSLPNMPSNFITFDLGMENIWKPVTNFCRYTWFNQLSAVLLGQLNF